MGRLHRYTDVRDVDVDAAVVWHVLADHERMAEWTPARRVVLEAVGSPDRNGVGAVRALHMVGPAIRERVTAFDPPRLLRYELLSGLPFRDYTGEIAVEPSGTGSRITTVISFRTVVPGTQFVVAVVVRIASSGLARAARRRAGSDVED